MKKVKPIHNLDSLEREIYRLQVEAMNVEKKLSANMDYLQENAGKIFINTFICKRTTNKTGQFFKDEMINSLVRTIADRIAGRAADSIDSIVEKLFHNRK